MWYESERLIAILIFFFAIVCIANTLVNAFEVQNTAVLGVVLLLFGKQLYTEAELDRMDAEKAKKEA